MRTSTLLVAAFVSLLPSCASSTGLVDFRIARIERLLGSLELQALRESQTGEVMASGEGQSVSVDVSTLGVPRSEGLVTRVVTAAWLVPDEPGWRMLLERVQRRHLGVEEVELRFPERAPFLRMGVPDDERYVWDFEAVPPGRYDLIVVCDHIDAGGRRSRFTYAQVEVTGSGDVATKRFNRFPLDKRAMTYSWYRDFIEDDEDWEYEPWSFAPERDPLVETQIGRGR